MSRRAGDETQAKERQSECDDEMSPVRQAQTPVMLVSRAPFHEALVALRYRSDSSDVGLQGSNKRPRNNHSSGSISSDEMEEGELTRILGLMNEQSASLILTLLCDDSLDLHQLEAESDNEMLESNLKAVRSITGSPSREDIARASRNFMGTVYTEGEVVSFAHVKLYDACVRALYKLNPSFALENCSLTFLFERILHHSAQSVAGHEDPATIYVSEEYYHIVANRLAAAIAEGHYSKSLSHPILQVHAVVQRVILELKERQRRRDGVKGVLRTMFPYRTDQNKYVLQWVVKAHSVFLMNEIVTAGYRPSEREIIKTFFTCSYGGNVDVMNYLLMEYGTIVTDVNVKTAFKIAADKGNNRLVNIMLEQDVDITDLSFSRQKKLFNMAAEDGNPNLCGLALTSTLQNHPLLPVAVRLFREGSSNELGDICNKLFSLACAHGHLPLADILMRFSDINTPDYYGRTPVMNAAFCGEKELFDLLVSHGADLSLTDHYGSSAIHIACWEGDASFVDYILPLFNINSRGKYDWTPVMNAVINKNKETFDLLVTKGADLSLTDEDGDTVLHLACRGDNTSIVNHLLQSFDINCRGAWGMTPIMKAASLGNKNSFDLLVSKGADLTLTDTAGDSVLHKACDGGHIGIVQHLLPSFDINQRGDNAHTPLMKAVCSSQPVIFDLLLSQHADTTLVDADGDTLLHLASEVGDMTMVERCFSDINCRNKHGWTPLMAALVFGEAEVALRLLKEGAVTDLLDEVGDDVITLAYRGGCQEIIEELNIDIDNIDETKKTEMWSDDMRYLVCGSAEPLLQVAQDSPRLVLRDGFGDTLLHLACRSGKMKYVKHILPSYDINVRGRYDWTPVLMAARCGCLDVFKYLLSHQADLSLVSDTGEDVLTLARRGGNKDIVMYLDNLPEFKDRK